MSNCSIMCTCGLYGIEGIRVDIEVTIMAGLPGFDIVGLGDSAVRESRDRVLAAIRNSGFAFPAGRLIASYAPAWLRKEGSAFDLPLALAILAVSGQLEQPQRRLCIIGELGLNGTVRPVPGVFCRALSCREAGIRQMVVPAANYAEAASVLGDGTLPVRNLCQAVNVFCSADHPAAVQPDAAYDATEQQRSASSAPQRNSPDIGQIVGQASAVRALSIAAAGRHNLLLLGSPGCGKTALAETLPGLLPELAEDEAVEVTRIYSASGCLAQQSGLVHQRPFRQPHHAVTRAALIGGGSVPMPGEVSLAHKGVLFLDEMTEFRPDVLDLLRQPLEKGQVHLNRLSHSMVYPADFLLVGAANPCRCGEYLEPNASCRCTADKVREHLGRLSGPLRDRMDLTAEMTRLSARELADSVRPPCEATRLSARLRHKIMASWQLQAERCRRVGQSFCPNGRLLGQHLLQHCSIDTVVARFAAEAAHSLNVSVRGYHKLLRVARTIADLDDSADVSKDHVAEALHYRLHMPES